MPLSGTTVGFVCVFALLMASIFAALLDRKEKAKGDDSRSRFLSRTALILFIAAFIGGVGVTLVSGVRPREAGQTMTGKPMDSSMGGIGGSAGSPPDSSAGTGFASTASEGLPMTGPAQIGKIDQKEIEDLKNRLEKNSKDVAALERMGHLALQLQDFESVFKLAHQTLLIDPKSAESLAHMGMVYSAMQQKDKALEQFDAALKINPKLTEALLFKGVIQFQSDDWKGAKETWDRFMVVSKPDDPGRVRVEMFLKTVNEQLSTMDKK